MGAAAGCCASCLQAQAGVSASQPDGWPARLQAVSPRHKQVDRRLRRGRSRWRGRRTACRHPDTANDAAWANHIPVSARSQDSPPSPKRKVEGQGRRRRWLARPGRRAASRRRHRDAPIAGTPAIRDGDACARAHWPSSTRANAGRWASPMYVEARVFAVRLAAVQPECMRRLAIKRGEHRFGGERSRRVSRTRKCQRLAAAGRGAATTAGDGGAVQPCRRAAPGLLPFARQCIENCAAIARHARCRSIRDETAPPTAAGCDGLPPSARHRRHKPAPPARAGRSNTASEW